MIELKLIKRNLEDKAHYLRGQGLIPAVVYGPGFENLHVSIDDIEFRKVYREAGTSNVIHTTGDFPEEMVLIQAIQTHVVSGDILSVDLKVVQKGEKTEVTVPFAFVGEAPAVKNNIGVLNISQEEVVIETIPSKIPDHIDIDISVLEHLGDSIKLSDIRLDEGVVFADEDDTLIVSISSLNKEEENTDNDEGMVPELVDQKGKETKEDE